MIDTKLKEISPLFVFGISALFATIFLFLSSNINAQATSTQDNSSGTAICSEQLQICVDEFNNLLSDFRNGTNCNSSTFSQLKKMNAQLSNDRDSYKQQAEDLKVYKIPFFMVTGLLIIWIVFYFLVASRSSKNKSGRYLNGRKTSNKRKETDS